MDEAVDVSNLYVRTDSVISMHSLAIADDNTTVSCFRGCPGKGRKYLMPLP